MLRLSFLALALLMVAGPVAAQEQIAQPDSAPPAQNLELGLQLMARGEIRRGGLPQVDGESRDKANFIFERTRLSVDYGYKWFQARAAVQHSGVWGQKGGGALSMYETWAKMTAPCGFFAQLGRMALSYDDERILGSNDWAMTPFTHDAVRLGYEGHGHKIHAIATYNQKAENTGGGTTYRSNEGAYPHKTQQTLWYHYDLQRIPLSFSVLAMNVGVEPMDEPEPKIRYQQLFGGYVTFTPPRWKAEAAYYHQTGRDEFNTPISAFMAAAKVTFTPSARGSVSLGYDYLSGDDNPVVPHLGTMGMARHDMVRGFCTIYGSHHKFYGAMDFFYFSAFYGGYTPGLQSLYVDGLICPVKNLELRAQYNYLAVASKIHEASRTLGHEIELSASYKFLKFIKVSAGYTYMHGTSTLERLQRVEGKNKLHWGWLMLSVTPRIFSKKW